MTFITGVTSVILKYSSVGNYFWRKTQEKLLLRRKICFAMYLLIKLILALTLNDLRDDA